MKTIMDAGFSPWKVIDAESEASLASIRTTSKTRDGPRILAQCTVSSTGSVTSIVRISGTVASGLRSPCRQTEVDETGEILNDPEAMALLREAEADLAQGRMISGDDVRKKK